MRFDLGLCTYALDLDNPYTWASLDIETHGLVTQADTAYKNDDADTARRLYVDCMCAIAKGWPEAEESVRSGAVAMDEWRSDDVTGGPVDPPSIFAVSNDGVLVTDGFAMVGTNPAALGTHGQFAAETEAPFLSNAAPTGTITYGDPPSITVDPAQGVEVVPYEGYVVQFTAADYVKGALFARYAHCYAKIVNIDAGLLWLGYHRYYNPTVVVRAPLRRRA